MIDAVTDPWIDDGTDEVRRALDAGETKLAQDLAGYIEQRVVTPEIREERIKERRYGRPLCKAGGCRRFALRRGLCEVHA